MNMPLKRKISIQELIYYLLIGIVATIFFQQVFVINIGGSFKIYELLSILLLLTFLFVDHQRIYGKLSLILFLFFVILPTFGVIKYFLLPLPYDYYQRFPNATNLLRTNIILAPLLLLIYYWFTWIVINYIISSKQIYKNRDKILNLFITVATIISLYNFYALIFVKFLGFPDIIPSWLDFRNSPTYKTGRFGGFSDEPGTYIILQTWVVYYLVLGNIKIHRHKLITVINIISWVMTMSSLLIPGIIILILFLFKKNKKSRFKILISCIVLIISFIFLVKAYGIQSQVKYIAKEKLENYVKGADHTLDSGSYRNFTTRLGFRLFEDNFILGTGPGTSCFYIWHYENQMGIRTWGERITETTYPQNGYAKIAAEMGILGIGLFILFFCYLLRQELKNSSSSFVYTSLAGSIFVIIAYFTVYPETSLFLWLNIALACNTLYHHKAKHELKTRSQKYLQKE